MFNLFEGKPDHPLFDMQETRRLIQELPKDDHRKALEDIAFWLDSIKTAKGFHPDVRASIILLLDQTALPWYTEFLTQYVSVPHLQDFKGVHQWQGIHTYIKALAEAYDASVEEYRAAKTKPLQLQQQLAMFCVRWVRALAEQMKLELMRYLDVDPSLWRQVGACQRFTESEQIVESMVLAYPGQAIHVSPQREILRMLLLYVAAPDVLAPDQIEVSYRIAGRMCSFFDLKSEADADCPYCFDTSAGGPPRPANGTATPDTRYFGAVRAVPALEKIRKQNEDDPLWQERRFGSEFTPNGKLTVLKHLQTWWGAQPPSRHSAHRAIDTTVEVVHGFKLISQLVTHMDAGEAAAEGKMGLEAEEEVKYTPETWAVTGISADEIGVKLSRSAGVWIKAGSLCGIKTQNDSQWWVGAIRRIHTDTEGVVHIAIGIVTRKPLSIWLRALGKGSEKASNWETSSGSFKYSYLPSILLPDAGGNYRNATMLLTTGAFVPGNYYQAMMGEKSHELKLVSLLAEGEDYEQVTFEWLT